MGTPIEQVLDGDLGKFWLHDADHVRGLEFHGYARLTSNRYIEVQLVDDEAGFQSDKLAGNKKRPSYITGATTKSGVLLCRTTGESSSIVSSESRVSNRRYRFQTAISDVLTTSIKSDQVRSIRARFPGMLRWAGMTVLSTEFELDQASKAKTVSIKLDGHGREDVTSVAPGVKIEIFPAWSVEGPDQDKSIKTALGVELKSRSPRSIESLLQPLLDVQLLFSTAHHGWVPCQSATASATWPEE